MSEPRPAYPVLVVGAEAAPPDLVAAKLDAFLGGKLGEYHVVLLLAGDSAAADWARANDYCSIQMEAPDPYLYGRRLAPVRWAMSVVAVARAVVIFGPDSPWWRVLRYMRDVSVPVRRVKVPAGYAPGLPIPRERGPVMRAPEVGLVLDGAGPGGWPD